MRDKFIEVAIFNPKKHIGKLCHVEGWPHGCQFILINTDGINHQLETPKTKKTYFTKNILLYTRRQYEKLNEDLKNEK